jgi:hypothetical protein
MSTLRYRAIFWSRFANQDYRKWLKSHGLRQVAASRHFIAADGSRDAIHNFETESSLELLEVIELETAPCIS